MGNARKHGASGATESPSALALRNLLDSLLASGDDRGSDVVVDVELDGSHYTITRHPARDRTLTELSPREREIARMIACGYTNKTIAAVLDISAWTVGTHLRRIYGKLEVHSRGAMVAQLAQAGLLPEVEEEDWEQLWARTGESKNH
jgi:DNA-binding CsgD family transcriptional regulator